MESTFLFEKSTIKCKGHGIFADELFLALDEVEFPFNLDYIWEAFCSRLAQARSSYNHVNSVYTYTVGVHLFFNGRFYQSWN